MELSELETKIENGGSSSRGRVSATEWNTVVAAVKTNKVSVKNLEDGVEDIENRVEDLETFVGDIPSTVLKVSQTDGKGSAVSVTNVVATIPANTTAHILFVAATDLIFTADHNATFADLHSYNAGTTTSNGFISELRADPPATLAKGTVLCNKNYTFATDSDVRIRGYFSGTVSLTITYGGFNAKDEYNKLSTIVDSNTARITSIESQLGGTSAVVNQYKNQVARALQLGYVDDKYTKPLWPIMPLVFMHISDTHKATHNTRAFEVLNYLGANGHVQFLMHTGDILENPRSASQSRWAGIVSAAQYPVMLTAGNHDVGNWDKPSGQYTTDTQFHNAFIAPVRDAWGLKSDGGGTPYISDKNYYFKDFTEQKVRYIVVYEYELPVQFEADGSTLLAGRGARWISQEQADWFVEALRTTPNGYGVIVAKHAPDGKRGEDKNPFNSPFLKGKEHQQTYQKYGGVSYTTFFADIVQAFIDKTTISKTIQQEAPPITGSVTINADFTATTNCEFICYVTGHTHADGINFLKDYPKQLDLNINCNNTNYQHYSNMQLIAGSPYEDAINVYSVDRNNGLIHVVRIGGEYSADGDRRDILTINYRNPNATTGDFDAETEYNTLAEIVTNNTATIANHEHRLGTLESASTIILNGTAIGTKSYSSTEKWLIGTVSAGTTARIILKAVTDLTYASSDNAAHTFVDVYRWDEGTFNNGAFISDNYIGNTGDSVSAGTIIYEGEYTFESDSDVYIRGRFIGTAELIVGGSAKSDLADLTKQVSQNTDSIKTLSGDVSELRTTVDNFEIPEISIPETLTNQVTQNANDIDTLNRQVKDHENRIVALEPVVLPTVISTDVTGVGNYSSTQRWKCATGLPAGLDIHIKIIATSDVTYSSADNAEHTFVDAVYYPTGTTTPTTVIFYNNANVGSSYPEGHIIKEIDYTIPQAADIWVRGRFAGSIKVEISYYE